MIWRRSHRFDPRAVALADRHYNRQKPGSPQFMPPGSHQRLLLPQGWLQGGWRDKGRPAGVAAAAQGHAGAEGGGMRSLRSLAYLAPAAVLAGLILMVAFGPRAKAADASSREVGPGWRIHECRPGREVCRWHGRVLSSPVACNLDLASLANTLPKGSRLSCVRVNHQHRISDR